MYNWYLAQVCFRNAYVTLVQARTINVNTWMVDIGILGTIIPNVVKIAIWNIGSSYSMSWIMQTVPERR